MKQIINFIILAYLAFGFANCNKLSETEKVVNLSLNQEIFVKTIKANRDLFRNTDGFLLEKDIAPLSKNLKFLGQELKRISAEDCFLSFCPRISFQKIKIDKAKAEVTFSYQPNWIVCSKEKILRGTPFFTVETKLEKLDGTWQIVEAKIKDPVFENETQTCLKNRFQSLQN